jgi:hypothetical protein
MINKLWENGFEINPRPVLTHFRPGPLKSRNALKHTVAEEQH